MHVQPDRVQFMKANLMELTARGGRRMHTLAMHRSPTEGAQLGSTAAASMAEKAPPLLLLPGRWSCPCPGPSAAAPSSYTVIDAAPAALLVHRSAYLLYGRKVAT